MQPGLLEAPIPTCWLLGGALPPGRGVVLRLQEMVGEGAAKHGDEGRGARGRGVSSGEAEAKTASKESWGPYNLSPWLTQQRTEPRVGRDHIQARWLGRG